MAAQRGAKQPLILWRISDGRRGHDSQSRGLAAALGRQHPLQTFDIDARPGCRATAWWLRGIFPPGDDLPAPDFIIGAGHATHLPMLAARRARGGFAIVLMRPSLPGGLFDACLVPAHDPAPVLGGRLLRTDGPLNTLVNEQRHDPARGIILVGGPSRHVTWDPRRVLGEVEAIVASGAITWTLSDSPRTPQADRHALRRLVPGYVPWEETEPPWLASALAQAATAWITSDSVSMVFEALTAGAAVGILDAGTLRTGRVARAMADLRRRGLVLAFDAWKSGHRPVAGPGLMEADRCAREILSWFTVPEQ